MKGADAMGNCRNCKHFSIQGADGYPYVGWGSCAKITDDLPLHRDEDARGPDDGRLAMAWDYEGYSAGVFVSPEFGCLMFAERES